jgi:EAL domain-containing protein (putative c-di-GMP-specific phosphodiesterase class I)
MNIKATGITEKEGSLEPLAGILSRRAIKTLFQPLISMKRRVIIGMEAVSRGISLDSSTLIPPDILFSMPNSNSELLALDCLCREKSLESFLPLHRKNGSLLVSLNLDAAIIDHAAIASSHLLDTSRKMRISPNNIIIEIIESRAADKNDLKEFVAQNKKEGFLIALDDVGVGHSNLDRIRLLKPDIIKIDRSLIEGINSYFYKREIVKCLQQMASKVGTMVLAEGIENEQEAIICMEMGIDFFQGFFFARPTVIEEHDTRTVNLKIDRLAGNFQKYRVRCIGEKQKRAEYHHSITKMMAEEISDFDPAEFSRKISEFMVHYRAIECAYVLNLKGVQVTDTIFNDCRALNKHKKFIYEPAKARTDHSLKEYFLPLKAGLRTYTTEPYISMATGIRCITIAAYFRDRTGDQKILCVSLDYEVF